MRGREAFRRSLADVADVTLEVAVALEGNLTDFSLADMFRLLQSGAKTGVLHVERDDASAVVCFRDGLVYFAGDIESVEPAGKRLVQSGVIAEKQLRQARGLMKIQKRDKAERRLGQILADEGYVDASVLERFVREQVSDALFDLLRWDRGELRFEPGKEYPEVDIGIAVPVDAALEDADRRLEMWMRIREKIPSMDTRFAMAAGPGGASGDIHLKPREWMVLCYLHGGRSVAELVELTGYNDFETARVIYSMYASGLITKVGPAGEPLTDE